jgi:hypothetical protein
MHALSTGIYFSICKVSFFPRPNLKRLFEPHIARDLPLVPRVWQVSSLMADNVKIAAPERSVNLVLWFVPHVPLTPFLALLQLNVNLVHRDLLLQL